MVLLSFVVVVVDGGSCSEADAEDVVVDVVVVVGAVI